MNPAIAPVDAYVSPRDESDEASLQPDVIVLLTDGASTSGVKPLDAAQAARDRGVQVYTIGFGTTNAAVLICSKEQIGSDELAIRIGRSGFGSTTGGRFGSANFLSLDEPTLNRIAEVTDAKYFQANSADEAF